MKQKITPEYVLEMLQELKKLFDEKKFDLQKFSVKYPTYFAFRKNLRLKGIIKKEYGIYKWISIEPNIIMAKELIKLYLEDSRQRREEFENAKKEFYKNKSNQNQQKELEILQDIEKTNLLKGKNTAMSLAKEIRQEGEVWTDAVKRASVIMKGGKTKTKQITLRKPTFEELFPNSFIQDLRKEIGNKKEHIEALQEEREFLHESYTEKIESLKRKYKQLQDELVIQRNSLLNKEAENSELKETIQSREKEIERLVNRIEDIDKTLPEPTYDFPHFSEPEVSDSQVIVTTPKSSKTYKLFGIPVFSINNK